MRSGQGAAQGAAVANETPTVLRDAGEVARAAAARVADAVREASSQRGVFSLMLSGGDTPRRLFETLAARGEVDWSRTEFFWGDERPVPPENPESNYGMARQALLAPLGIDPARIHRIEAERADLDVAARDYADLIAKRTGHPHEPLSPPIDLLLLGIGDDGHTASLFPHTRALSETQRWVVVNDVPRLKTRRITITFPLIERARAVLVLVCGDAKAGVLAEILEGPRDPERLPAQRIGSGRGRVTWLVDAAAASRLGASRRRET